VTGKMDRIDTTANNIRDAIRRHLDPDARVSELTHDELRAIAKAAIYAWVLSGIDYGYE